MGKRPAHLETGQISPRFGDLGIASGGRIQLLIFERGHWCGACLRHLAGLDGAAERIAAMDVDLIVITHEFAVNVQEHPYPQRVDPALDIGVEFGIVDQDETGYITLRPTTLIVNDAGEILFSFVGDDSTDRPTAAEIELMLGQIKSDRARRS